MSVVVLALLGGLWAFILAPRALRAWRQGRPMTTVDSFEYRMSILSSARSGRHQAARDRLMPAQPVLSASQARRARLVARRRAVVTTLAVAAVNLVAAAIVFGGTLWVASILAVSVLAGYVAMLAQLEARRTRARRTVRRVPRAPAPRMHPMYSSVETLDAQGA